MSQAKAAAGQQLRCLACEPPRRPGLSESACCGERTDTPPAYGVGHPLHRLPHDGRAAPCARLIQRREGEAAAARQRDADARALAAVPRLVTALRALMRVAVEHCDLGAIENEIAEAAAAIEALEPTHRTASIADTD